MVPATLGSEKKKKCERERNARVADDDPKPKLTKNKNPGREEAETTIRRCDTPGTGFPGKNVELLFSLSFYNENDEVSSTDKHQRAIPSKEEGQ